MTNIKKTSIQNKLILYTLLLLLFMSITLGSYTIYLRLKDFNSDVKASAQSLVMLLADVLVTPVYNLDVSRIATYLKDLKLNPIITEALVLNHEGQGITNGTDNNPIMNKNLPQFKPYLLTLAKTNTSLIFNIHPTNFYIGEAIRTADNKIVGFIIFRVSTLVEINQVLLSIQKSVIIILILFLVGAFSALLFSRKFTKPLLHVIKTTEAISKGNLNIYLPEDRDDELGALIIAINNMVKSLKEATIIKKMQKVIEEKTIALSQANENLKQLVIEAESANKIKSQFVANMSHELRTPLNAIIGYSEMLKEDAETENLTNYASDLTKIIESAKHLLDLINDVLDLAKIESGKLDIFLEKINIKTLIQDLITLTAPLFEKNNNTFKLTMTPDPGMMYTDVVRVRQCLINLLSNASKFTKNGSISLDVSRLNENDQVWIHFTVTDTGIGIPDEKLTKLFQAFSQTDTSTTRQYGGTGLGLYLSKLFCEMLGGKITVQSTAGQGSTFTLILPAESS